MENQNEQYQQLITRFLSGEATQEEQKALQLWLDASEKNRKLFAQYESIWGLEPVNTDSLVINKSQAWKQIQDKIGFEEKKPVFGIPHLITTLAAMVLLAVGLFQLLKVPSQPPYQVLAIEQGSYESLKLSDGSVVSLNGPATFEFPEDFTGKSRLVRFAGEGYFEVHHQHQKQFIIEVEGAIVKVLGTDFYLSSHPEAALIEVVVMEGKVMLQSIKHDHEEIILTANQRVVFDTETGIFEREEITDLNFMAWHNGLLTFNETPLYQVFEILEKTYGIRVNVNTDVHELKLTARYTNEEVHHIFQTIGILFDLQIEHHEDQININ